MSDVQYRSDDRSAPSRRLDWSIHHHSSLRQWTCPPTPAFPIVISLPLTQLAKRVRYVILVDGAELDVDPPHPHLMAIGALDRKFQHLLVHPVQQSSMLSCARRYCRRVQDITVQP